MTKNIAASVRQRLLNRAKSRGEGFNELLVRYGIERLLYRISRSQWADDFVLKGANLFYVLTGELHRPTLDVDMLHYGDTSVASVEHIIKQCLDDFREDDGLVFALDSVEVTMIREREMYAGVRVALCAFLGKAKITLQLDVGTGDAVTPSAQMVDFPCLLDGYPKAQLRAYRFETMLAEKCEAMVKLGLSNSRLKDFYDVYFLIQTRGRSLDFEVLCRAVHDTFARRRTPVPDTLPIALSDSFCLDPEKVRAWQGFLRKSRLDAPSLSDVAGVLATFLMPIYDTIQHPTTEPRHWNGEVWCRDDLSLDR